jgi:hypothetical protein
MNLIASITICIFWFFMVKWFKDNTCVFGNHEFQFKGTQYICKKCGLTKRIIKK